MSVFPITVINNGLSYPRFSFTRSFANVRWLQFSAQSRRCFGNFLCFSLESQTVSWKIQVLSLLRVVCVSFRRYRPLKLPLSCANVQKGDFKPSIIRGGDTPDFGRHVFWNHTHLQTCGQFGLSSVRWVRTVADEKKIEVEDRIAVKPNSAADKYVGRPNKAN